MMESVKKLLRPLYLPVSNAYHLKFKSAKRYHHLFNEIEKNKATTILEVGTWNGNRALEMIKKAQENSDSDISYVGFDLFEGLTEEMYISELSKRPPSMEEVKEKLEKTGAKISLLKGNTLETLPVFVNSGQKFDFIFIDGGHDVNTVQNDWDCVSKLMHKNTVVIFDDYWKNRPKDSAKPVVDKIDRSLYEVEILPEVDVFDNPDFGRLEISFAKVKLKKI